MHQKVYYIDNNFIKEDSLQYILSIRCATDGLSFCVHHATTDQLLAFFFQPLRLDGQDALISKIKVFFNEEQILNLKYKKTYLLFCYKEKTIIPDFAFKKEGLPDLFRVCFQLPENNILLHRRIDLMNSYLIESHPRHLIHFLQHTHPDIQLMNGAYPFIMHALKHSGFHPYHLFMDIHHTYFDLLLLHKNHVLLFNSFNYNAINDIIYHTLNSLQQYHADWDHTETTCSGNLIHTKTLSESLNKYLPNFSVSVDSSLKNIIKSNEFNYSSFIHLLNIHHLCES